MNDQKQPPPETFLTTKEAAKFLKLKPNTLEKCASPAAARRFSTMVAACATTSTICMLGRMTIARNRHPMSEYFINVEIAFFPEFLNNWLRFDAPAAQLKLDRRRSIAFFRRAQVFGYVRWQANEYGRQTWRFFIVRTRGPHTQLSCIAGIQPGAELLLSTAGRTKVKRALQQIETLETNGFPPADVSPNHYRHVHNRIATRQAIRPYTAEQHIAYLTARTVLP